MDRRDFLRTGTWGGLGVAAAPTLAMAGAPGSATPASDTSPAIGYWARPEARMENARGAFAPEGMLRRDEPVRITFFGFAPRHGRWSGRASIDVLYPADESAGGEGRPFLAWSHDGQRATAAGAIGHASVVPRDASGAIRLLLAWDETSTLVALGGRRREDGVLLAPGLYAASPGGAPPILWAIDDVDAAPRRSWASVIVERAAGANPALTSSGVG